MSSLGLGIGLRALLSSQSALDTTGHNIANANTPGYSRQAITIQPSRHVNLRGLAVGTGVDAKLVERVTDELLNKRFLLQFGSVGKLTARLEGLSQAELLFGADGESGLGASLDGLFGSLSALSSSPGDSVLRTGAVQAAADVGTQLRDVHEGLESLRADTARRVQLVAGEVNGLARQIVGLNDEIVRTEAAGTPANDLRDRRDEALRQLSGLVDVRFAEEPSGSVRVLLGGHLLIGSTRANALSATVTPANDVELRIEGVDSPIPVRGGELGGLSELLHTFVPDLQGRVDDFARTLIFEFNRAHSTGVPTGGPFQALAGEHALVDQDGDGAVHDELLSRAGLPFPITAGELYVNVTDRATGQVQKQRLTIDPARTTVGDLLSQLSSIDHLNASLDASGRVQLSADAGFGFDFSRRLISHPDVAGSFGGGQATLGAPQAGPYALANGDTLDLVGPLGPYSITFAAGSFRQIGAATAAEIAAVINADAGAQSNGLVAADVGGVLVLQSAGSGSGETFTAAGGSALAALGLAPGQVATGSDTAVAVDVSGTYTGDSNRRLLFRPTSDGTIGTTPGLQVEVLDATGARVALLDVGAGYRPGDELEVLDGVRVSFGLGDLSASDGDVFALDAAADSDTSDVLAALGLNGLFTGTGSEDVALRREIELDPSRLAVSTTGASGDGSNLLDLLALATDGVASLGGATLGQGYGDLASGVGLDASSTESALDTEQLLLDGLQARRDSVSAVNLDEELVNLIEYERAFAAASQYIRVINELTGDLLSLV